MSVQHELYSGGMSPVLNRELVRRGDSVAILVVDPAKDTMLVVEQFRAGAHRESNPWLLELPAGMIDDGETAQQAAARELREETGILKPYSEFSEGFAYYPSAGACDERVLVVCVEADLDGVDGRIGGLHGEEDIRCKVLDIDEAWKLLTEGKIQTGSLIIAISQILYMREVCKDIH